MIENKIDEIKRQSVTGNYVVHGAVNDADCVIAFSFGLVGEGESAKPGQSNKQIAQFAKYHFATLPKLFQWEVADAYPDDGTIKLRIARHRQEGEYLHTFEVAEQIKSFMYKNKFKAAALVAHPFHVPRCDAVCGKLGIDTVVPAGLGDIDFDSNSSQEWTRNKEKWAEREPSVIDYFNKHDWL